MGGVPWQKHLHIPSKKSSFFPNPFCGSDRSLQILGKNQDVFGELSRMASFMEGYGRVLKPANRGKENMSSWASIADRFMVHNIGTLGRYVGCD